jgi:hypothetical protein
MSIATKEQREDLSDMVIGAQRKAYHVQIAQIKA